MSLANVILIAGLGNPGRCYGKTRHNAGFMVVDDISRAFDIPLHRQRYDALFGRGSIEETEVLLAKPMGFMNNSGPPIQRLARFFRVPVKDLLVIHDDVDLAYGRLKVLAGSSHVGHKGIRSLTTAFGSGGYTRLRIGVGPPADGIDITDHVLGEFTPAEEEILGRVIARAREGVQLLLREGIVEGMNQVNNRRLSISQ